MLLGAPCGGVASKGVLPGIGPAAVLWWAKRFSMMRAAGPNEVVADVVITRGGVRFVVSLRPCCAAIPLWDVVDWLALSTLVRSSRTRVLGMGSGRTAWLAWGIGLDVARWTICVCCDKVVPSAASSR